MKKILGILVSLVLAAGAAHAACTQAFPTSAKAGFLAGTYDTADTYKIAFYTDSATYSASTTAYAATNEVSGTGYSAGGFTLSSPSATTSGTTGMLDFVDAAPSGVTFGTASTCAVLYNSSKSNAAIGVFTFTSVQPTAGTLTIDFPASGASTSTLRIALVEDHGEFKAIADGAALFNSLKALAFADNYNLDEAVGQ